MSLIVLLISVKENFSSLSNCKLSCVVVRTNIWLQNLCHTGAVHRYVEFKGKVGGESVTKCHIREGGLK